jgi:hypothetical protein
MGNYSSIQEFIDFKTQFLLQENNYAPIFHNTSQLIDVLRTNKLLPSREFKTISFTRDYGFAHNWYHDSAVLVINKNKLSRNYKLIPYDFYNDSSIDRFPEEMSDKQDEMEEYVTKPIVNLDRYLVSINITKPGAGKFLYWLREYPFFSKLLKKHYHKIGAYVPHLYKNKVFTGKELLPILNNPHQELDVLIL